MMKEYTKEKREELIWALSEQHYSNADLGEIFNIDRVTVFRIIKRKPEGYKSRWVKRQ